MIQPPARLPLRAPPLAWAPNVITCYPAWFYGLLSPFGVRPTAMGWGSMVMLCKDEMEAFKREDPSSTPVLYHEHRHVLQQRVDGLWTWSWRYFASLVWRLWYESEAYAVQLRAIKLARGGVLWPEDSSFIAACLSAPIYRGIIGADEALIWARTICANLDSEGK